MADISLDESLKICESAIAKAIEIGIKISVSVVDSGTNLVTTQRMAGSLILTVDSSRGKAVASVMFVNHVIVWFMPLVNSIVSSLIPGDVTISGLIIEKVLSLSSQELVFIVPQILIL